MSKLKKELKLFKRKNQDCTSFYFILCGERMKIVDERRERHRIETGGTLSWQEAVNLVILGK